MKKILMFGIIFVAVVFAPMNSAFAVGISGQSVDVTVGEVDKIDTGEDRDINAPQTGVFGLEFNKDFMAASAALIIPIMIFLVFLFRSHYLRSKRNRLIK